jgi:hypothetical protein
MVLKNLSNNPLIRRDLLVIYYENIKNVINIALWRPPDVQHSIRTANRIDIHIEVSEADYEKLSSGSEGEGLDPIPKQV